MFTELSFLATGEVSSAPAGVKGSYDPLRATNQRGAVAMSKDGKRRLLGGYYANVHSYLVYVKQGDTWVEEQTLNQYATTTDAYLRPAINANGTTIAYLSSTRKSLYVYGRVGSTWTLTTTLSLGSFACDFVSISDAGDVIVANTQGSSTIKTYHLVGGTWNQDTFPFTLASTYGTTLSGDGNYLFTMSYTSVGTIWTTRRFSYSGTTWQLDSTLPTEAAVAFATFGGGHCIASNIDGTIVANTTASIWEFDGSWTRTFHNNNMAGTCVGDCFISDDNNRVLWSRFDNVSRLYERVIGVWTQQVAIDFRSNPTAHSPSFVGSYSSGTDRYCSQWYVQGYTDFLSVPYAQQQYYIYEDTSEV